VPGQFERFVLGEDEDPADVRVDAVGQREVDDPIGAAKRYGWFGQVPRERVKALTGASRQQYPQDALHGSS
jgi:hypothetical protein